ncbi:MAG: transglutaminase domain-containing protein [Ruminococcus sp.]|nr:transglutaminase domain-containing protein [Ruminococcus sp.]
MTADISGTGVKGNEKTGAFVKKHLRLILPFMLTVVLGVSLYSVYQVDAVSLWTAGIILMTAAVFALCEFINKHHLIGGIILTFLIFGALRLFFGLVFGSDYGETFQKWFLTGADQIETKFEYLLALMISLIPFFGVVVYYFTNVLYRMSFLTLVSLIPCAVYVKVLSEIDNVFICLIAILNVAVLMMNVRLERGKNRREIGQRASLLSACVFTFALLVISTAVPKENDARYYDRFEELFMDSGFTVQIDENFSLFSDISGNADSFRNFSNRRMYTLYGDNVPYFKRQTFDNYDFDLDAWTALQYYSEPAYTGSQWTNVTKNLSLGDLRSAMIKAGELDSGFIGKYGLERLTGFENFRDEVKEVFVQCEDFGAVYFLSPARVMYVSYDNYNTPSAYVTRGGVVRTLRDMHPKTLGYTVLYRDEFNSRNYWFELGGADFDSDTSKEMLREMAEILGEEEPLTETVNGFLSQQEEAERYKEMTAENTALIPQNIKNLAEEIAGGCSYDWEKANALQNYFINDDFVYDLNYAARDSSPEYFLFESKRGSCSDFASAFALMARSLGLTVRYAEGYSPDITSREGVFVIKDSCSHAYPEVFIQNMGWAVFEPTVPSDYNNAGADDGLGGGISIDYDMMFVMCIIGGRF